MKSKGGGFPLQLHGKFMVITTVNKLYRLKVGFFYYGM